MPARRMSSSLRCLCGLWFQEECRRFRNRENAVRELRERATRVVLDGIVTNVARSAASTSPARATSSMRRVFGVTKG